MYNSIYLKLSNIIIIYSSDLSDWEDKLVIIKST